VKREKKTETGGRMC